ncbi:glycosyltransferase family 9 protein [Kiritimatiella glycovorans]|uniref:Lipopolysaccharide core heptosyltransferase RfaQ n=1 Tax=Kiritimatiella glycovorans TaxID=1307763 RepID=A0A0G3EJZ5_9BACT|nr:glycosyltransferase family 9 protein [Kiritimatiella glycovorans]AKJ64454.1 Lipopolysaccharide core heptosyltransferase RfaQ [Kiritimatiella glycovorans]
MSERAAAMRFSALGDIAAALPFLRALKVRPAMVTSPAGRELLRDEFPASIVLPDKRLRSVAGLVMQLRRARFEVMLDLQNNDRSKLIAALCGAKTVYSNRGMPRGVPACDNFRRILEPSGLLGPLDESFESKPRDYIVLHPGSSARWRSKRLPDRKWTQIAVLLRERYGLPLMVSGGPDEADYAERLTASLPVEASCTAGTLDLQGLKRLLAEAYLVVSTDSAPMHLAAAMKTPTIGIFGATSWVRSAPFGPWSTVVYDRVYYADGRPPVRSMEEVGPYYENIDIGAALDRLAPYLNESGSDYE